MMAEENQSAFVTDSTRAEIASLAATEVMKAIDQQTEAMVKRAVSLIVDRVMARGETPTSTPPTSSQEEPETVSSGTKTSRTTSKKGPAKA